MEGKELKYDIVTITPEIAEEMLTHNSCNRGVSGQLVKKYADDMMSGNWDLTPQPIVFDKEGVLMDGQHRLMAVVRSGLSNRFVVCTGAPLTYNIDVGRKRTILNQLQMKASVVPPELLKTFILSVVRYYLYKNVDHTRTPTTQSVEQFIFTNHASLSQLIGCVNGKKIRGISIVPVQYALFMALQNGVEQETVARFYRLLVTGIGNGSQLDNMVLRHRNYLMSLSLRSNQKGSTFYDEVALKTQKVLSQYASNKPLQKIYTPKQDIYSFAM
jgi:hypothetical protein